MPLDAVANFVRGETTAAIDNAQTTVSVADASIFPDPSTDGEYNVVIWDATNFPRPDQDSEVEILRVTATDATADELTVVRAQETTLAAAHPSGSAVHLSPTAKMFSDIESEYTAQGADFDGEGTSEFSNLASLGTEKVTNIEDLFFGSTSNGIAEIRTGEGDGTGNISFAADTGSTLVTVLEIKEADDGTVEFPGSSVRLENGCWFDVAAGEDSYISHRPTDIRNFPTDNLNGGDIVHHNGSGLMADCVCRWRFPGWRPMENAQFTYTGDGTQGRTIVDDFVFDQVVIESADGTVVDAYETNNGGLSNGAITGNSFAGELNVEFAGGITIGDNGADADPNTDGETYSVYVG